VKSLYNRPVGWRNESHRHYLAAKGICTNYFAEKDWKTDPDTKWLVRSVSQPSERYLREQKQKEEAERKRDGFASDLDSPLHTPEREDDLAIEEDVPIESYIDRSKKKTESKYTSILDSPPAFAPHILKQRARAKAQLELFGDGRL
jgi:hypothetical protein